MVKVERRFSFSGIIGIGITESKWKLFDAGCRKTVEGRFP